MDFFEKVKGFLLEPSKTFDATKGENLSEAIKYYAAIAAIYSALFAVLLAFVLTFVGTLFGSMMGRQNLGMLMGAGASGVAIIFFVLFMIFAIVGAFVGGAILHIFVYIVGGRKGIAQTIKAVMYGSTPQLLLGWIPIIGIIAAIWSLVVEIIGIRQLHELTTGKAVLAVLIPIIIAVIIAIVLAAILGSLFGGMGPPTPYGRGY
jgi:hypothetical protein